MSSTPSVLVVCLGNICRSPIGEAVLKHVAKERGLDLTVDSAGTSNYHIGEDPDDRSVAVCRQSASRLQFEVPIKHAARQVKADDFRRFTHILAADEANLRGLERVRPRDATADVRLWGAYLDNKPIPDPYYGGVKGFEEVYHQCVKLSNAFLDEVVGKEA
ncbi:phosphotyrosine protein phosphatase [Trametes gibbosa]|nr:phosphotyrosine protein phosphatase [Trametes gibbosa]